MEERESEPEKKAPPQTPRENIAPAFGDNPSARPPPLDYRPVRQERVRMPMMGQLGLGMGAWVVVMVGFSMMVARSMRTRHVLNFEPWMVAGVALAFLVFLCILLRGVYKWRGFIPGVLLGFGLSFLLPLGIVAILCGHW